MTALEAFQKLKKAKCCEEIFGELGQNKLAQEKALKNHFHKWVRFIHPDLHKERNKAEAEQAFKTYQDFFAEAKHKVAMAIYGDKKPNKESLVVIASNNNEYTVQRPFKTGDITDLFIATNNEKQEVIIKISRSPANNDLVANEGNRLKYIKNESPTKDLAVIQHIPIVLDSFEANQNGIIKHVNVFEYDKDFITLQDVINAYPKGIDIRDAMWMFNRVLGAMLAFHQADIIHGSIIPEHILINPETHNGKVIDWCYSVKAGDTLKAISPENKQYYPPEVFAKIGVGASTDIYMLGCCIIKLIGGDIENKLINSPYYVPRGVSGILKYCVLQSPKQRPNDAYELYQDLTNILEKEYGPRKFRPFVMP